MERVISTESIDKRLRSAPASLSREELRLSLSVSPPVYGIHCRFIVAPLAPCTAVALSLGHFTRVSFACTYCPHLSIGSLSPLQSWGRRRAPARPLDERSRHRRRRNSAHPEGLEGRRDQRRRRSSFPMMVSSAPLHQRCLRCVAPRRPLKCTQTKFRRRRLRARHHVPPVCAAIR